VGAAEKPEALERGAAHWPLRGTVTIARPTPCYHNRKTRSMFRARFPGGSSPPITAEWEPVQAESPADRNGMRIREHNALKQNMVQPPDRGEVRRNLGTAVQNGFPSEGG
jgi:hypothetical protein